jgi:hypothetical protein
MRNHCGSLSSLAIVNSIFDLSWRHSFADLAAGRLYFGLEPTSLLENSRNGLEFVISEIVCLCASFICSSAGLQ